MDNFKQLIANARENAVKESEIALIAAIEKRGAMSQAEESRLWQIADR